MECFIECIPEILGELFGVSPQAVSKWENEDSHN